MVGPAPRYNMMAPVSRPGYAPTMGMERGNWNRGSGRRGSGHRGRGERGQYRSGYYGYGGYSYPYYYAGSWELLPGDLDDSGLSDDDTQSQPAAEAPQSQPEYEPGPDEGYREDYAPPPRYEATAEPAAPPAPVAPEPKLTLIFKDGHTQQIHNYVLTSSTLVDLDEANSGRELQIPLSSLNLTATEQAAQEAGLEFSPPTA